MTQKDVALFVVASAVIAIVPGPDILYLVGRGVAQGRRAGVASALGLNVGALIHAALAAFGESVATDLLNPKVYLFFVSFLPQFVEPNGDRVAATMLLLGALFVLVNLPVDPTIALLAGRLGELLVRRPSLSARVRWAAGGMLVALGLRVAVADGR